MFYSYFAALGLNITVEDSSSHGRLDMAVLFNGTVYLFEFKVVELSSAGAALAQLQERRYADKYRGLGQPIYLIGVEFTARMSAMSRRLTWNAPEQERGAVDNVIAFLEGRPRNNFALYYKRMFISRCMTPIRGPLNLNSRNRRN